MKKVKLLINTAYKGPRKEGDVLPVPEDFAKRWVKNGIAEYVNEEISDEISSEEPAITEEPAVTEEVVDYSEMTAKDLYALCKEKGLEVEAKKGKEYYIEKLNS